MYLFTLFAQTLKNISTFAPANDDEGHIVERNRVLEHLFKTRTMKKKHSSISVLFMMMSILFCVCLIASNLFATKQIAIGTITVTGGLLIFPISYIVNDCVCEVWGYRKARLLIWTGFAMNFFFVLMGALCDIIPPAPYYENNEGFHAVFGLAPRVAAASFMAFLVGSFMNAYVMSRMKIRSNGKHFSVRAVISSIIGEGLDSIIFFPLALGGVIPWEVMPQMVFWQVVLKTSYEILVLPVTVRVIRFLKKHEQVDVYDEGISYAIWKVFNI